MVFDISASENDKAESREVEAVEVLGRNVWIETDIAGSKHVMIQHDHPKSEPFTYCTFNYDYAYTSNVGIRSEAENMALALGATRPVEDRFRGIAFYAKSGWLNRLKNLF